MKRLKYWLILFFVSSLWTACTTTRPVPPPYPPATACRDCQGMIHAIHLSPRKAILYNKTIHKYATNIAKAAQAGRQNPAKASHRIRQLRIERDRKISHILTQVQFKQYIRLTQEQPQRIHDRKKWSYTPRPSHPPRWDDKPWHGRKYDLDQRHDKERRYKDSHHTDYRKHAAQHVGRSHSPSKQNNKRSEKERQLLKPIPSSLARIPI